MGKKKKKNVWLAGFTRGRTESIGFDVVRSINASSADKTRTQQTARHRRGINLSPGVQFVRAPTGVTDTSRLKRNYFRIENHPVSGAPCIIIDTVNARFRLQ